MNKAAESIMALKRQLALECLNARLCMTSLVYGSPQTIDASELSSPTTAEAADMDGDGDQDLVTAGLGGIYLDTTPTPGAVSWIENLDGKGTFGSPRVFHLAPYRYLNAIGRDFDGDGDIDIAAARVDWSLSTSAVEWFPNLDGKGTFGEPIVVAEMPAYTLGHVEAVDMDEDGDVDLVHARDAFYWYRNDGRGQFRPAGQIALKGGLPRRMLPTDLNRDGDLDLILLGENSVEYVENLGQGTYSQPRELLRAFRRLPDASFEDLDQDGDTDIVAYDRTTASLLWFNNLNGSSFGPGRKIAEISNVITGVRITVLDFDGDKDPDIVATSESTTLSLYENLDGKATFGAGREVFVVSNLLDSLRRADLDADGDFDLLLTSSYPDEVNWYEVNAGLPLIEHRAVQAVSQPGQVELADFDHDGDLDLLASSDGTVAWYPNDGKGHYGQQRRLAGIVASSHALQVADVDQDGDLDVLSASMRTGGFGSFAWYENSDGQGTFAPANIMDSNVNGSMGITAGDVDGDGDVDIAVAATWDAFFAWFENVDGKGTFSVRRVIDNVRDGAEVRLVDLDGDRDLDLLTRSRFGPALSWYQNDGRGGFGARKTIGSMMFGGRIFAEDLDLDGLVDVAVAGPYISWHKNLGGGNFSGERSFATVDGIQTYLADLDRDGDMDALHATLNEIGWAENVGNMNFELRDIVLSASGGALFAAGDLDGDADIDLIHSLSHSDEIVWQENLGVMGDVNDDGRFDSSDLLQMYQTGEYEDGVANNSTRAEGDWNGDGDFTSADLVFALRFGRYED